MEGFRQFYSDNVDRLFRYLLRKSGNEFLAADLTQESFARYLERYRKRDASPALLFTIGRNLFNDHFRRQANFQAHQYRQALADPQGRTEADQEERFIAQQQAKRIEEAIRQLSADEQDILALVIEGNMKYQDIARIRECSLASVKVTVHRARKKLKTLLEETDDE